MRMPIICIDVAVYLHCTLIIFTVLRPLGDNMLTALSVARDCHMVEPRDKTILVQTIPPSESQDACIKWNYAEEVDTNVKEIMTKRLQVSTIPMVMSPEVDSF